MFFSKNSLTIKTFPLFLFLMVMIEMTGCDAVAREEMARISSPDFRVDAILIRANAGATTSFVFEVYIVQSGDVPTEDDLLFRGDKMEGLKLRWVQSKLLTIQYEQGRIFHFSNFWSSQNVQNTF
ncbi:MAG: hypothetical protein VSS75_014640 [Candidatus Parabeggiatoa sp.]|nr:hypothetical protein [Candidatus Parabeggiatoa sp.]